MSHTPAYTAEPLLCCTSSFYRLREKRCFRQSKQNESWREVSFDLLWSGIIRFPAENKGTSCSICKTCLAFLEEVRGSSSRSHFPSRLCKYCFTLEASQCNKISRCCVILRVNMCEFEWGCVYFCVNLKKMPVCHKHPVSIFPAKSAHYPTTS